MLPTPLEVLADPISIAIFAIYFGFILLEAVAPARKLPAVPGWRLKGFIVFVVYFFLATYLPMIWDPWLAPYQLIDLSGLNVWAGVAIGILVFETGVYVWHRAMHTFDPLWLGFHQMHHSAERVDTIGAFYFSPLDAAGFAFFGSLALVLLVGLDAQAATITLLATTAMAIFTHTNIRTPRWIGYIIQRPESHSVHHERGVHAKNYSELAILDILFGTFENPRDFRGEAGFYDGASKRVLDILLFKDVSKMPLGRENRDGKESAAE